MVPDAGADRGVGERAAATRPRARAALVRPQGGKATETTEQVVWLCRERAGEERLQEHRRKGCSPGSAT
eukprot:4422770-Heterocapsa_arctica.AAC.1